MRNEEISLTIVAAFLELMHPKVMHEADKFSEARSSLKSINLTLKTLHEDEEADSSQSCLVVFLDSTRLAYCAPREVDSQIIESALKKSAANFFIRVSNRSVLERVPIIFQAISDVTSQCCAAMADAAPRKTMTDEDRLQFAVQVMSGSALMAKHNVNNHFGALKDSVTAPGGMTIRGVHKLRNNGFQGAIMDAVCDAATQNAQAK